MSSQHSLFCIPGTKRRPVQLDPTFRCPPLSNVLWHPWKPTSWTLLPPPACHWSLWWTVWVPAECRRTLLYHSHVRRYVTTCVFRPVVPQSFVKAQVFGETRTCLHVTNVNEFSFSPNIGCASVLVVDEVWQEQTLLRLLNLVELPLLEGVLQCSQAPSSPPPLNLLAHKNPDLIYSSNHLDRQILKAFRDSQWVWLCC